MQSSESTYDSRLFNQTSSFGTGFNEDQPYDKPLYAAQDTINSIYRSVQDQNDESYKVDGWRCDEGKVQKASRFELSGKATKGFKGSENIEEICDV